MIKKMSFLFIFVTSIFFQNVFAKPADLDRLGVFSGRISKSVKAAKLLRVRLDFVNSKFLRAGDKLELWHQSYPSQRCECFVEAKANEYIFINVPLYDKCVTTVGFTVGSYVMFESKDLEFNINVAREMIDVLMKKRMIILSQMEKNKTELGEWDKKIENTNDRYKGLMDQLKNEWSEQVGNISALKSNVTEKMRDDELTLGDVDYKLERYRIESENLKLDRWSLDPSQYVKK